MADYDWLFTPESASLYEGAIGSTNAAVLPPAAVPTSAMDSGGLWDWASVTLNKLLDVQIAKDEAENRAKYGAAHTPTQPSAAAAAKASQGNMVLLLAGAVVLVLLLRR